MIVRGEAVNGVASFSAFKGWPSYIPLEIVNAHYINPIVLKIAISVRYVLKHPTPANSEAHNK